MRFGWLSVDPIARRRILEKEIKGGLSRRHLRLVLAYINENLHRDLRLQELSSLHLSRSCVRALEAETSRTLGYFFTQKWEIGIMCVRNRYYLATFLIGALLLFPTGGRPTVRLQCLLDHLIPASSDTNSAAWL